MFAHADGTSLVVTVYEEDYVSRSNQRELLTAIDEWLPLLSDVTDLHKRGIFHGDLFLRNLGSVDGQNMFIDTSHVIDLNLHQVGSWLDAMIANSKGFASQNYALVMDSLNTFKEEFKLIEQLGDQDEQERLFYELAIKAELFRLLKSNEITYYYLEISNPDRPDLQAVDKLKELVNEIINYYIKEMGESINPEFVEYIRVQLPNEIFFMDSM